MPYCQDSRQKHDRRAASGERTTSCFLTKSSERKEDGVVTNGLFTYHLSVHMASLSVVKFTSFVSLVGFPGRSDDKASACNVGDQGDRGSVPGSGRSPGEGNGNPLQYSCLDNSMD